MKVTRSTMHHSVIPGLLCIFSAFAVNFLFNTVFLDAIKSSFIDILVQESYFFFAIYCIMIKIDNIFE